MRHLKKRKNLDSGAPGGATLQITYSRSYYHAVEPLSLQGMDQKFLEAFVKLRTIKVKRKTMSPL